MWLWRSEHDALRLALATASLNEKHLREQLDATLVRIGVLEGMLKEERGRTDEAVDQMLRVKGLPPVTPPVKPPMLDLAIFEEDPAEVKEIVHAIKERGGAEVLLGEN